MIKLSSELHESNSKKILSMKTLTVTPMVLMMPMVMMMMMMMMMMMLLLMMMMMMMMMMLLLMMPMMMLMLMMLMIMIPRSSGASTPNIILSTFFLSQLIPAALSHHKFLVINSYFK